VPEADVTAPTDPASVDVMTGCYNAANNKTPRAESPTPMERLRVTRTHDDGAVLRSAYHGLKAQGYVRTPFHGGRIAGWKLVNSLTKIPIRLDARRRMWSLSRLKSAAKTHDTEGITAISRWLSEATPPDSDGSRGRSRRDRSDMARRVSRWWYQ
jgi:hypothetical protein